MAMVVMGVNETSFDPLVLLPVVLSSLWILWDVFYASYFLAFLLQSILNLFLKDTKISIGKLHRESIVLQCNFVKVNFDWTLSQAVWYLKMLRFIEGMIAYGMYNNNYYSLLGSIIVLLMVMVHWGGGRNQILQVSHYCLNSCGLSCVAI